MSEERKISIEYLSQVRLAICLKNFLTWLFTDHFSRLKKRSSHNIVLGSLKPECLGIDFLKAPSVTTESLIQSMLMSTYDNSYQ